MSIYLDNAATTQVCSEAAQAALDAMTLHYGNPSSTHAAGREAAKLMERARAQVSHALGCRSDELVFTSCGSEGDNWAIKCGAAHQSRIGRHIVSSGAEHAAVLRALEYMESRGYEVTRLKPRSDGAVAVGDVLSALRTDTCMVSLMLVNNETGAINPVEYIAPAVRRAGAPALIHIDAIQGFGKLPFRPARIGADLVSVSGHKLHAPKGVGALYIRKGVNIQNYVFGGGQESGLFSGTENVPGIAGFGAAVRALPEPKAQLAHMQQMNAYLREKLGAYPQVSFNSPAGALPYILNLSVAGIPSQVLINFLSARGIYVSAGSACKKGRRSEVLTRMGLPPAQIDSAIRVSMSRFTTEEELSVFAEAVGTAIKTVRTKL